MEDPSFTNLYRRSIERRKRLKEEPIKPSRKATPTPVTILHTGSMFTTITSPNTGNLIWVSSSKTPIGDRDDVTITTATESSSSCRSTSLSGFSLNLESDSDGSNESQLKPIQERVATKKSKPRPILKKRSKSEPRYICGQRKSHWACLPPPTDLPEEVPLSTSFKRSRSVRVDDTGIEKHVGFGRISFRSYQQTVGDNPAVSYGFPISLDWEYEDDGEMEVNDYELRKGHRRRNLKQLAMSYYKRKSRLLEEYGIEKEELDRAKKDCNKAKFLRGVTTAFLPIWKVEDVLESTGRKAKRILGIKNE
mmetsp:Transcript_3954/g.9432  ORF Transcript_3954/g.9432 Transcript_3954/m.9432 type:complete len:307 (+) Transcript_3954:220-1140(+)